MNLSSGVGKHCMYLINEFQQLQYWPSNKIIQWEDEIFTALIAYVPHNAILHTVLIIYIKIYVPKACSMLPATGVDATWAVLSYCSNFFFDYHIAVGNAWNYYNSTSPHKGSGRQRIDIL